jgi:hypothetical protein
LANKRTLAAGALNRGRHGDLTGTEEYEGLPIPSGVDLALYLFPTHDGWPYFAIVLPKYNQN